jgi:hypothetical protein
MIASHTYPIVNLALRRRAFNARFGQYAPSEEFDIRRSRFEALFEPTEPEQIRGRPRFCGPGCGVHIGYRAAVADSWLGKDGMPIVRFSTGRTQHWYRFLATIGSRTLTGVIGKWNDHVSDLLADWLAEEMDDGLD